MKNKNGTKKDTNLMKNRGLWEGPNGLLVLPESLKLLLLWALHITTHLGIVKITQIIKIYWWNDCSK